jgi:hypothetical protein
MLKRRGEERRGKGREGKERNGRKKKEIILLIILHQFLL